MTSNPTIFRLSSGPEFGRKACRNSDFRSGLIRTGIGRFRHAGRKKTGAAKNMKPEIHWFAVQTREMETIETALVFCNVRVKPAGPDHVWLCDPAGEALLRAPKGAVKPLSQQEVAERILEDARWRQQQRERERFVRATLRN